MKGRCQWDCDVMAWPRSFFVKEELCNRPIHRLAVFKNVPPINLCRLHTRRFRFYLEVIESRAGNAGVRPATANRTSGGPRVGGKA